MKRVEASVVVPGPVEAVEALWWETARWPAWIDGFGRVVTLSPGWPQVGAVVEWDSRPGGRGRVRERVAEPGGLEVEDASLTGVQRVRFDPADDGSVRVAFELAYELKERNAATPLVDLLYIRRALRASLQRTLARFTQERVADAELG